MTKKVLVVYSNRAEEGMLIPIMKRIQNDNQLELLKLDLREYVAYENLGNIWLIYDHVYVFVHQHKPDIALVGFDRQEMIFSTLACFHNRVPWICHFMAGDCDSGSPVFDEAHRFAISCYANVHFCTSQKTMWRIRDLMNVMGRPIDNIYRIPPTNLDDLEFDNHLVPEKKYDLVLLHPCTTKPELTSQDIMQTEKIANEKDTLKIVLNPNGDTGSELIDKEWRFWAENKPDKVIYHPNGVPRPQFLALLRDCDRFISNSSSTIYEAPHFLEEEQIVNIGLRNKNRERLDKDELTAGGSDLVVKILRGRLEVK